MQIKIIAILLEMLLTDLMKLTPCSRILLRKLPITHLVQDFCTVYGTSRYVAVFMRPDVGFCTELNGFSLHFSIVVL